MNRPSLTQSVKSIRVAIEFARDQDTNADLLPNCDTGIRICDDLITTIESTDRTLTVNELMGRFNYFASDALPWTDSLLATINRENKNIKSALRDDVVIAIITNEGVSDPSRQFMMCPTGRNATRSVLTVACIGKLPDQFNVKRNDATEPCGEREPPMARVLESLLFGGGPVIANVRLDRPHQKMVRI